jgi:hypothetical protein
MIEAPHHALPDPAHQLRRDIAHNIVASLHELLPPPAIDTPEAWESRNRLAVARATALAPDNFDESDFASQYVACLEHSRDCLRLAAQRDTDPKLVTRLHAQQASMGREARAWRSALARMQTARRKEAARDGTRTAAAGSTPGIAAADEAAPGVPVTPMADLMTEALASLSPMPPPPRAPVAAPPPGEEAPPRPLAWSDLTEEEQRQSLLWQEADRYAICHTARVKRIRQLGGLPPNCDYEPPRPEILDMIIHGETSNLIWADSYQSWAPPPTE